MFRMTICILLSSSVAIVLLLPLITQPLRIGLVIILSTLLICILGGLFFCSWYTYILFLIYIGGLLVIFAYVAALIPNILFSGKKSLMFFVFIQSFGTYLLSFSITKNSNILTNWDVSSTKMLFSYALELISSELFSVYIGLALILLLNLVVVVKICYYYYGSLRPYKEEMYAKTNSKNTPIIKGSKWSSCRFTCSI